MQSCGEQRQQNISHRLHSVGTLKSSTKPTKNANARKKGDALDTAADPMTLALHKKLLEWSLEENDMHAWH